MAHPVIMPKAGQSMTEGTIVSWIAKEGDKIERGDPLLEIETDKANLEVEAVESGYLRKIFYPAGEACPVLSVIAILGGETEDIDFDSIRAEGDAAAAAEAEADKPPPPAPNAEPKPPSGNGAPRSTNTSSSTAPSTPQSSPATPTSGTLLDSRPNLAAESGRRVLASPLARRIAKERDVDLTQLQGTGPGGRVLRRDVEAAPRTAAGTGAFAADVDLSCLTASPPYPASSPRPPAKVELTGMRAAIAKALSHSKQSIPHFYETVSIDVTAALSLRSQLVARGRRISVNDLVVRAVALALVDEPRVNCRVFPEHVEYPAEVNIGVAVGVEDGLVVPVVQNAHALALDSLAVESRRVIDAAREGKLIGSGSGTFTISNLGMFGVESFSAIINPPEGAILAVGAARAEVVPIGGGLVPRAILRATISCDHRAIDGVLAARFLTRLRFLLENPDKL